MNYIFVFSFSGVAACGCAMEPIEKNDQQELTFPLLPCGLKDIELKLSGSVARSLLTELSRQLGAFFF